MLPIIHKVQLIAVSLLLLSSNFVFAASTPDYYQCDNKIGGEWNFGRVPNACDVAPWGSSTYVSDNFSVVTFEDDAVNLGSSIANERVRYMQELYAMLRDSSSYYITQRKPIVSQLELDAWQRAIFALAHQETFWTHYRHGTDTRIKMVRGDFGHGHGIVQIDDRWHFTQIEEGKGWQIFENLIYGMELYYSAWENAATATCVSDSTNWRSRARSAYSVYNGGASKICRWTDPNDIWAQNDNGYRDKYDAQLWLNYVADLDHQTTIDVPCFMQSNLNCSAIDPNDPNNPTNWSGVQINLSSGEACIFTAGQFECVNDPQDFICLNLLYGATVDSLSPDASATTGYVISRHEKHQCFKDAVDGLSVVGQSIQTNLNINVRSTPGGTGLGFASQAGKNYQVLNYVVSDEVNQNRYYLIKENGQQGYIYAGGISDHPNWAVSIPHSDLVDSDILIAQTGDGINIESTTGINLRDQPGGNYLTTIPHNTQLEVESVVTQGADNFIYYQVSYQGYTGFIYGGKILNGNTLADWATYVELVPPPPPHPMAGDVVQIVNLNGSNLRATPGGTFLVNVPASTLVYVFETVVQGTNDYLYYRVTYNGQTGYIYGGQLLATNTVDSWAITSSTAVAKAGENILITSTTGINMRATPGGAYLQTVPTNTQHVVVSNVVKGDNNYVYYQISYLGQTGFIYGGRISPDSNLGAWASLVLN